MDTNEQVPELQYTLEETAFRNRVIERACVARNARDVPHAELDDMTYVEYYESNRKKDLSRLPPKKNKDDVQIVTGTTREKDTTLLSTLLNMNLEPDITAFDQDELVITELGENMGDMVKKSRQIEDWEKKRPIIYREMIAQGDVFTQELWVEDFRPVSLDTLDWNPIHDTVSSFELKERVKKVFCGASVRMIPGPHIYLGNIHIEYVEDQDEVFVYFKHKRSTAKARYGEWERWKNVPKSVDNTIAFNESSTYNAWNMSKVADDEVGEVFIYLPKENRFNIMLNGVLMLPHNYPLTAISPTGELPLAQGKLEPISGFAYSKSQPSKTKVDQAVLDEMTKLMIRKTRQSAEPPKGNTSKKVLSKSIFLPGKITNSLREGQLFDLVNPNGVSPAEFSFYSLIKESLNEKSVNEVYSGESQKGVDTLGQSQQMIDQQMLKLGHALDGVVNLEKRLTWNRLHTVLQNWTKPIDTTLDDTKSQLKEVYRSLSVRTTLNEGQQGVKIFRFTTDEYPEEGDQEQEEAELEDKYGQPVSIVYMDPEELRMLKALWYIVINPVPKQQDKLSVMLFVQNLRQGYELFGPESFNLDYLKQRYAVLTNENYNKMFKKMGIMDMLAGGMPGMEGDQGVEQSPVKFGAKPKRMQLKPVSQ